MVRWNKPSHLGMSQHMSLEWGEFLQHQLLLRDSVISAMCRCWSIASFQGTLEPESSLDIGSSFSCQPMEAGTAQTLYMRRRLVRHLPHVTATGKGEKDVHGALGNFRLHLSSWYSFQLVHCSSNHPSPVFQRTSPFLTLPLWRQK